MGSMADLKQAAWRASEVTKIAFSVGGAPVSDLPCNHADRLRPVRGLKLRKLIIDVPDKYDLVLSKAIRGWPHDLEAIKAVHVRHPLSEKTLVRRFETEIWNEAVGDPRKFALNMVAVMGLLYGDKHAASYRAKWLRE